MESRCLRSVGYDRQARSLELEFVSGDVYRYRHVPQRVHKELMAADSHGTYFTSNIRPVYKDYVQVR